MRRKIISGLWVIRKAIMNFLTNPAKMLTTLRQLNIWYREDNQNPKAPFVINRRLWLRKCRKIIVMTIRQSMFLENLQVIEAFYTDNIVCVRDFPDVISEDEVILITAVKNDSARLEHFLKHYREIGVKHFVFIDNGSDDGTVEKVLEQKDTACYIAKAAFSSKHKAGWFNRLAAHYGENRWYIAIDSDELFAYPQMDNVPVGQYVKKVQANGFACVKTVLLDVYPDGPLMDESKSDEEYLESCIYFDRGDILNQTNYGGMRARLFFNNTGVNNTCPRLFYFKRLFLLGPHSVYPRDINESSKFGGVAKHYKFLPSDKVRNVLKVRDGSYYDGSAMYRTIVEKTEQEPVINAMSEVSVKWDNNNAWQYLPMVEDLYSFNSRI